MGVVSVFVFVFAFPFLFRVHFALLFSSTSTSTPDADRRAQTRCNDSALGTLESWVGGSQPLPQPSPLLFAPLSSPTFEPPTPSLERRLRTRAQACFAYLTLSSPSSALPPLPPPPFSRCQARSSHSHHFHSSKPTHPRNPNPLFRSRLACRVRCDRELGRDADANARRG